MPAESATFVWAVAGGFSLYLAALTWVFIYARGWDYYHRILAKPAAKPAEDHQHYARAA